MTLLWKIIKAGHIDVGLLGVVKVCHRAVLSRRYYRQHHAE